MLSTGKVDYLTLTALALAEEKTGSGWISKLVSLVGKSHSDDKIENAEVNKSEPGAQTINAQTIVVRLLPKDWLLTCEISILITQFLLPNCNYNRVYRKLLSASKWNENYG